MRIAVLSGKGGTGKTLLAVNLAAVAKNATYIDCDVEEPNGHLFFKPEGVQEEIVTVRVPQVENERCNGCRKCVEFCNFNALAYAKELIVFEEICHSCGGCIMTCPEKALTEKERAIGIVQKGTAGPVRVLTGMLNPGEPSGVPVIKKLLAEENPEASKEIFLDSPPGSACIVMESIKDADYCILVAEPTIFGVHNLNMVYELVRLLKKPFGVVLNKCLAGENPAEKFCLERKIKILGRIPFDQELGRLNSNARIAAAESEKYAALFVDILEAVRGEVRHETVADS
ncbi:MAG: ATPase [Firmicutes bacterium]|jgi:MinD superfamily P-loop ATPase|nr:ATPase [Bacillota bacterium]